MFRYGIAAVVSVGVLYAPAPGIAWADADDSGSASTASAGSADAGTPGRTDSTRGSGAAPGTPTRAGQAGGEASGGDRPFANRKATKDARVTDIPARVKDALDRVKVHGLDRGADTTKPRQISAVPSAQIADPPAVETVGQVPSVDTTPETPVVPEPVVVEVNPVGTTAPADVLRVRDRVTLKRTLTTFGNAAAPELSAAVVTPTAPPELSAALAAQPKPAQVQPSAAGQIDLPAPLAAVVDPTTVETTTPVAPQPLSPGAKLLELPGRIVNAVLEALDFTSSANSPTLPVSLTPINDLIFGAFREVERLLGLQQPPPPQPAVPTLTYDGPTDRPTPTVAQFLNASTAAYVLGSTPGDLKPFVVNGRQMSRTNILTGMVGKAWVTPEGQVIIAYQGTTGGTHLLFNPLIVIPQVIADLQIVFTGTTPGAFHDALDFAEQVQAEAALQGYGEDDLFVTGHSLGGWEAQYVAQQTGLSGIGFEAPGINTVVDGNGAESMFVNIGTYGSSAPYMSTDLPGLQPFMPPYVPGGGSKPHYGPIVMVGDPAAMTPLYNAAALWGRSPVGSAIFLVDYLMNFFQYHLPGVQAYHLDVTSDPGVVPFLGTKRGPVHTGYGDMTIPELMAAASADGILFRP